jgi:hypothetical protein
MLRQTLLLEFRKQIEPFLSLLVLILLSLFTVVAVTYISTGYVLAITLEVSWAFLMMCGTLFVPLYLGSYWGAALRREPIQSIEEVLPITARLRKTAAWLTCTMQFAAISIVGFFLSYVFQSHKGYFAAAWFFNSIMLLLPLTVAFLCSYRTKNAWTGVALAIFWLLVPILLIGTLFITIARYS